MTSRFSTLSLKPRSSLLKAHLLLLPVGSRCLVGLSEKLLRWLHSCPIFTHNAAQPAQAAQSFILIVPFVYIEGSRVELSNPSRIWCCACSQNGRRSNDSVNRDPGFEPLPYFYTLWPSVKRLQNFYLMCYSIVSFTGRTKFRDGLLRVNKRLNVKSSRPEIAVVRKVVRFVSYYQMNLFRYDTSAAARSEERRTIIFLDVYRLSRSIQQNCPRILNFILYVI